MTLLHTRTQAIRFGDCDPAGIVYYPNFLRWFDGTFHDYLGTLGGHRALCARLGSAGIGLIAAGAEFRRPGRDGDTLWIRLSVEAWDARSFRLAYAAHRGETLVAAGTETRGVFVERDGRLAAGPVEAFRALVEAAIPPG